MTLRALYGVPAPAKLNLYLHVVGRRADGYHLLQSLFVLIDWADTLQFELRTDGRLARHDSGAALPADDLCLRAARALQAASGCTLGADISIDKQVPSGAGMGGGSSDAATTLLALNRLWRLGLSRADLLTLALPLGADVPFFVGGSNARVEGIGERLQPADVAASTYAVVKPPVALATQEIFQSLEAGRSSPAILVGSSEEAGRSGMPADWMQGTNHLQPAAESRCPEVAQAARWLAARYGNSRMTGSGSAVFARVETEGSAVSPVAAFPAEQLPPGWVGRLCRGLQQHPLAGWAS